MNWIWTQRLTSAGLGIVLPCKLMLGEEEPVCAVDNLSRSTRMMRVLLPVLVCMLGRALVPAGMILSIPGICGDIKCDMVPKQVTSSLSRGLFRLQPSGVGV